MESPRFTLVSRHSALKPLQPLEYLEFKTFPCHQVLSPGRGQLEKERGRGINTTHTCAAAPFQASAGLHVLRSTPGTKQFLRLGCKGAEREVGDLERECFVWKPLGLCSTLPSVHLKELPGPRQRGILTPLLRTQAVCTAGPARVDAAELQAEAGGWSPGRIPFCCRHEGATAGSAAHVSETERSHRSNRLQEQPGPSPVLVVQVSVLVC